MISSNFLTKVIRICKEIRIFWIIFETLFKIKKGLMSVLSNFHKHYRTQSINKIIIFNISSINFKTNDLLSKPKNKIQSQPMKKYPLINYKILFPFSNPINAKWKNSKVWTFRTNNCQLMIYYWRLCIWPETTVVKTPNCSKRNLK